MERSRSSLTILDETRLKVERLTEQVEHGISYSTFDDWRVVSAVGNPSVFQNAWVNYAGVGSEPEFAAFWKDSAGIIRLRGIVKDGTVGTAIFTLPQGYRPLGTRRFPVIAASALGYIAVLAGGEVNFQSGSNGWVSLDNIAFRAEK